MVVEYVYGYMIPSNKWAKKPVGNKLVMPNLDLRVHEEYIEVYDVRARISAECEDNDAMDIIDQLEDKKVFDPETKAIIDRQLLSYVKILFGHISSVPGEVAKKHKPEWRLIIDYKSDIIRCTFCSECRGDKEELMIQGHNGMFICCECVALCNEIIAKNQATPGGG